MADIKLITCVGVEYDLALLPHFVNYYTKLGIPADNMHIVLQASQENTAEMEMAGSLLDELGIEPHEIWIATYTSDSMWEKRREVQEKVAKADDWVISADVDEFHEFPGDLSMFLSYCDKKQLNCIQGVFIDRLAPRGKLIPVQKDRPIWDQFPIQADVICTLRQEEEGRWTIGTVNIMACKGNIFPSKGGHGPAAGDIPVNFFYGRHLGAIPGIEQPRVRFALPLRVHHFKWTDSLLNSLRKRLSTPGVSERGKLYGEVLLNHIDNYGRIHLDNMPIRKTGLSDRLPWKYQIRAFELRLLAVRVSNKMKRLVKK